MDISELYAKESASFDHNNISNNSSTLVPTMKYDQIITDFEARLALARILSYDDKELEAAKKEYRILLKEMPNDNKIRMELARVLMRQKKYQEALRELNFILKQTPEEINAQFAMGKIYLWNQEYEKAIQIFKKIHQDKTIGPDFLIELARAYQRNKQYDKAIEIYYEYIHRSDSLSSDIYVELGDSYLYSGKLSKSIENYKKAAKLDPTKDSIQKKLALALSWNGEDEKALSILSSLYPKFSKDLEISIELARIYSRRKKIYKALPILLSIQKSYPDDISILLEIADLEGAMGHAKTCRELYTKALDSKKDDEEFLLRFADRMNMWGDFYKSEKIYRKYLKRHPGENEVSLKLAWALISSQRYEEAEGIYRKLLLEKPDLDMAILGLARLKFMEKDFKASYEYANQFLLKKPEDDRGLLIKGDALFFLKQYNEAVQTYARLTILPSQKVKGFLSIGKVCLKQQKLQMARKYFDKAYQIKPESVETQFYHAGFNTVVMDNFLEGLIKSKKLLPEELNQWGQLYASYGFNTAAILCYKNALKRDSEYFPARMSLAEVLAVDHQYDGSINIFKAVAADFPENSKILIGWARVLGWSKQYHESIDLYEKIRQLNPIDPVPQKEGARTAVWGKMIDFAMENYQKMLSPSVDQKLVSKLLPITSKIEGEDFFNYFKRLKDSAKKGSVYKGYEEFVKHLDYVVQLLSSDQKKKIESAVIELLPAFKIQKAIYLESLAKWLVWNKWYKKAIKVYQELIDFKPGNEEAYFDCAQVECILGLCDIEGKTYQNLLNIDPLHSLARKALERQNIRSNPSVDLMHWYWKEEGRDDLAQITRNRTDLALDIPIFCRYHLRIVGHRWLEDPQSKSGSFAANGHTLGFNGILSPHIKLETGWTNKNYTDEEFRTRDTGYAYVWFNLRDHALLGLGYDKTNELYNYFGIKQGIQADSWWISGALNITRQLEIELKTKYLDYKDHNEGNRYFVSASYQFTDHPRIFKITLSGKYLDTERTSLFKYEGDTLIDIIHPYWAPESHKAGNIIFEWYHDISKFLFCGSELHFYDLRLGYGNETENNHSVQFEGEWHYEFYNHWIYSIKGLLHRSRDWDSEAVWAMLKYQF